MTPISTATMGHPDEFGDRIAKLETTVGDDHDSGLRGEIREIKRAQETLFERLRAMELRGYAVGGGVIVIIWIIEHATKG